MISKNENIIDLAINTIALLQSNQVIARIYGGVAVGINCSSYVDKSRIYKDIDIVCRYSEIKKMRMVLLSNGYVEKGESQFIIHKRQSFVKNGMLLEFVFDELNYCHRIVLKNRLKDSYPTISISDLFLSKIQNVNLSAFDVLDLCALLSKFDLSENQYFERISGVLSTDYGFYKTVIQNLDFVGQNVCEEFASVTETIKILKNKIVTKRKSIAWNIQKIFINQNKWYNSVE